MQTDCICFRGEQTDCSPMCHLPAPSKDGIMDSLMEASDLHFQFGKEPLFSGLSFGIYKGDFVALTGPNGAGKSTLLKILLGELTPQKGTVRLFNQDIRYFTQWPKIGYMPQNSVAAGVNFPATAQEIVQANLFSKIGLMRPVRKVHRQKALEALDRTGMADYAKQPFSRLSGGQQQRVMLARVLVNEPNMMILDEPTTGIDVQGVQDLLTLLSSLNRDSGSAILMVTHDMARASEYAGRTLCLEFGSLVELTKCQIHNELIHKHRHDRSDGLA
jgi:zinc transport system ATP-binding protein